MKDGKSKKKEKSVVRALPSGMLNVLNTIIFGI